MLLAVVFLGPKLFPPPSALTSLILPLSQSLFSMSCKDSILCKQNRRGGADAKKGDSKKTWDSFNVPVCGAKLATSDHILSEGRV